MTEPILLPEETISLDDDEEEEARRQVERELAEFRAQMLAEGPPPDVIEAERASLGPPTPPRVAEPGAPAFTRDPEREARLNTITSGAPAPARMRSPGATPETLRAAGALPSPAPRQLSVPDLARSLVAQRQPVSGRSPRGGAVAASAPAAPPGAPRPRGPRTESERYQAALDAVRRNRTRNMIVGLIGALIGGKPADIAALGRNQNVPLEEYEGGRRIRAAEAQRGAQETRERSQLTRQERQDALAERRYDLDERRLQAQTERESSESERRTRLDESLISLRDIQVREAEGDAGAEMEMRDPSSNASLAAQDLLRQAAPRLGLTLTDERITGLSAQQVRTLYPEVMRGFGNIRRGAGTGGAGTGGARGTGGGARSVRQMRDASQMASSMRRAGYSQAQIEEEFSRRGIAAPAGAPTGRDTGSTGIPGWRERPDAPQLTAPEYRTLRALNADIRSVNQHIGRMQELGRTVSAAERAGNRAVVTESMQDARATHELITVALRNIGHYGVPQAAELERMEALAPRLTTADGIVNAVRAYGGMRTALDRGATETMASYGYERDTGQPARGAAQRQPAADAVRFRDPETGRTGSAPRDVVEDRGYEVLE